MEPDWRAERERGRERNWQREREWEREGPRGRGPPEREWGRGGGHSPPPRAHGGYEGPPAGEARGARAPSPPREVVYLGPGAAPVELPPHLLLCAQEAWAMMQQMEAARR